MKEEESITQSKNYLLLFFDLYPIFFFIVLNIGKLLIATVPTMEIRINVNLFGLTEARLNKNSSCWSAISGRKKWSSGFIVTWSIIWTIVMTEPTKINGSVSRMIETEADRFSFEITAGNQKSLSSKKSFLRPTIYIWIIAANPPKKEATVLINTASNMVPSVNTRK